MNIFIFPIDKKAAKYAKLDRVGSLDADLQQVPLVLKPSETFTILL